MLFRSHKSSLRKYLGKSNRKRLQTFVNNCWSGHMILYQMSLSIRQFTNFIKYFSTYIRGFTKFGIKILWRLRFLEYMRTKRLKFQKAWTKIEVVLSLPCWLSQQQLQFWSEPSEILIVRSWSTPETVAFTISWYQTWWNP